MKTAQKTTAIKNYLKANNLKGVNVTAKKYSSEYIVNINIDENLFNEYYTSKYTIATTNADYHSISYKNFNTYFPKDNFKNWFIELFNIISEKQTLRSNFYKIYIN